MAVRRWRWWIAAATFVTIAAGLTVWLLASHPSAPANVSAGYGCDYARRDGRLYAGHSDTSDRLVALNAGSADVVEVQCVLISHGFDPGRVDGLYGPHTEQAVKQLQSGGGEVVDGIVGPKTWALLRS